jgi:tRNA-dihydrouridine synthase B
VRSKFYNSNKKISALVFICFLALFFYAGNVFPYNKLTVDKGNNFLTISDTVVIDNENFTEQFLKLEENSEEAVGALLENANFTPAWIPSSGIRFQKDEVIVKQADEDVIIEMENKLRKPIVVISIDGNILIEWIFYNFDTAKLWIKSPMSDTISDRHKKYLIGWMRYVSVLRNRKMLNTIANFRQGEITKKGINNTVTNEVLHVNNIKKWDIVFVEKKIDSLSVELPIAVEDYNLYRGSTFARIILCDLKLGLISKIVPVKIVDNTMYLEVPLQGHNIVVEKIFSINSYSRASHLFRDKLPFGVSFTDSALTKKIVRDVSRQARKRSIVRMKTLPKATVATMGEHTDVVFANIIGGAVYPTNNGASILGYFKTYPHMSAFQNLELALSQGAAIVQIACDPSTKEDDNDICNAFARSARLCLEAGAGAIDINMCGIVGNSYGGAGLMSNPRLCRGIVSSVSQVVQGEVPILVKIRTGASSETKNAVDIAKIVEQAGASAIIILAQTADKQFDGPFDYDSVQKVKEEVTIPVIVNGGITSPDKAKDVLLATGADAVMIGRASVLEPGIIKRTNHYLSTGELLPLPSAKDSLEKAKRHLSLAIEYYGRNFNFDIYLKHFMSGYMHNILYGVPPEKRQHVAESLMDVKNTEELNALFALIREGFEEEISAQLLVAN